MNEIKVCTKCKQEQPLDYFSKKSTKKSGLRSVCKICVGVYCATYRQNNRTQIADKSKLSKQLRLEKGLCLICIKSRLVGHDLFCEYHYFVNVAKGAVGKCDRKTVDILRTKLDNQGHIYPYTGRKLVLGLNTHLDHIYPKQRFPELANNLDNLEWVSDRANIAKNDMTKLEFLALCETIVSKKDLLLKTL